jgi:hypothetical protein
MGVANSSLVCVIMNSKVFHSRAECADLEPRVRTELKTSRFTRNKGGWGMKLESVRLTHAQSVPNCFIANQIYHPVDDEHRQRGSFIILLTQTSAQDGSFVASLTNTLIREYYRQTHADRLGCFEQTLLRLNDQIKQYSRNVSTSVQLSGTIVLLCKDEIHLTHIGTPVAYLAREQNLIPLIDEADESATETAFGVITSGEVLANDILVLVGGLQDSTSAKSSITFSLTHTPLFETARAYARILKQAVERDSEAIFVRFNEEVESTSQIYVDRALETSAERMSGYQKSLTHHFGLISSGAQFFAQQAQGITKKVKRSPAHVATEPSAELPLEIIETAPPEATAPVIAMKEASSAPTEAVDSSDGFTVRTYWQSQAAKPEPVRAVPLKPELQTLQAPTLNQTIDLTQWIPNWKALKPRTAYLLIGILVIVGVAIRVTNTVGKTEDAPALTAVERDNLIAEAASITRDAEAAQVQDDTPTAITKLLKAKQTLGKISVKSQNEASKALGLRIDESLTGLTKTTILAAPQKAPTLDPTPKKVIASTGGAYIIGLNNSFTRLTAETLTPVKNLPTDLQLIDAVGYDNLQKVAVYAKTSSNEPKLFSITGDEAKEIKRADGKPWPDARLLASFEANIYFIGDTMWKAIPSGDAFKVVAYAYNESTAPLTGIVNNGFAFYALEQGKQILRIAANSPKTPVKIFGVPEDFLPAKMNRLLTARKEGLLYVYDHEKQRVLAINTDGKYRSQWQLPNDQKHTDCDSNDTQLICVTESRQVRTYNLGQ